MMNILIAVPCMDMVATPFAQSIASLNKIGNCVASFQMSSLIYDARNKLAKQALETEADYVMWFDSDMVFEPNTLERLLEDDKDIVSGLYFRRVQPFTPVLFKSCEPDSEGILKWNGYDDYPKDSLFEVAGVGFGCVLIKSEVFLDMFAKFGTCFETLPRWGEDISFCYRARELGYQIYCDSRVKCGHVAHTLVTEDFSEAYGGLK